MARTYPLFPEDTESRAELELFERLRQECPDDWWVLHSVGVGPKGKSLYGEADFVVIYPGGGAVCIETKTYVAYKAPNLWRYRAGKQWATKGPLDQAERASIGIGQYLNRLGLGHITVAPLVILPRTNLQTPSSLDSRLIIEKTVYQKTKLPDLIRRAFDIHFFNRQSKKGKRRANRTDVSAIVDSLRKGVDCYLTPTERVAGAFEEAKSFTEEQMRVLDQAEDNPRLLVDGLAGTGKTVMAIEAAQRAVSRRRRVLFLCFNRALASHLRTELNPLGELCTAHTFHEYCWNVVGEKVPLPYNDPNTTQEFWTSELPKRAADTLLRTPEPNPHVFDELIVDEAQDLLRYTTFLPLLKIAVSQELPRGHWKMFGDFQHQQIFAKEAPSIENLHTVLGFHPAMLRLRENCRNTPRVAELAANFGGLGERGYRNVLRADDYIDPVIRYYTSPEDQARLLESSLHQLLAEGIPPESIVILSRFGDRYAIASKITDPKLLPLLAPLVETDFDSKKITYCSVSRFKGRESGVVILTDMDSPKHWGWKRSSSPEDDAKQMLYIGATRAIARLVILMDADWNAPSSTPNRQDRTREVLPLPAKP